MLHPSLCVVPLLVALGAAAWRAQEPSPQEPSPPPPPPPASSPDKSDKVPGKDSHPLEGVYELRKRFVGGRADPQPGSGYVAITHSHMFLFLAAPGPHPSQPLLRSGVRTWEPRGELVQTKIVMGYYTNQDGTVRIEKPGTEEIRRVDVERGRVRIHQDGKNWLEFERIE